MLALHAHYNVVSDKVCPRAPGAQIRVDSHVTQRLTVLKMLW